MIQRHNYAGVVNERNVNTEEHAERVDPVRRFYQEAFGVSKLLAPQKSYEARNGGIRDADPLTKNARTGIVQDAQVFPAS